MKSDKTSTLQHHDPNGQLENFTGFKKSTSTEEGQKENNVTDSVIVPNVKSKKKSTTKKRTPQQSFKIYDAEMLERLAKQTKMPKTQLVNLGLQEITKKYIIVKE